LPYNGSGTFVRVMNWVNDAAANIRIRADRHDDEDDNFASGLSQCITKDGQTTVTANLPMANYRHTNVGEATAITHYARYDQLQLGKAVWADAGGTADAITATYSPNTSAPVDGQLYFVRASAANATTTPTFSPDGNTARTVVKYGNQALVANDIAGDGHELILRYRSSDTRYELINPAVAGVAVLTGNNTFSGNNTHSGTESGIRQKRTARMGMNTLLKIPPHKEKTERVEVVENAGPLRRQKEELEKNILNSYLLPQEAVNLGIGSRSAVVVKY